MLLADAGLKIDKESTEVDGGLAPSSSATPNGSAVVVEPPQRLAARTWSTSRSWSTSSTPRASSVYSNDIPGIEQALAAVPFIPARGDAVWVNDQVLAAGKPKSVEVKVGVGGMPYNGEQPEIEVSDAGARRRPDLRDRGRRRRRQPDRRGPGPVPALRGRPQGRQGRRRRARGDRTPQAGDQAGPLQRLLHRRPDAAPSSSCYEYPTLPGQRPKRRKRCRPPRPCRCRRSGKRGALRRVRLAAGRRPALLPQLRQAPRRPAGRLPAAYMAPAETGQAELRLRRGHRSPRRPSRPEPAKPERDFAPLAAVGGIAVLGLMLLVGVLIGKGRTSTRAGASAGHRPRRRRGSRSAPAGEPAKPRRPRRRSRQRLEQEREGRRDEPKRWPAD